MRGQVSVFIILGLVLLVVTALVLYTAGIVRPNYEDPYQINADIKPLYTYMETCLEHTSEEPLQLMGHNAGKLEQDEFRYYNGMPYRYLGNIPLLRQDMELELSEAILENLRPCVDLTIFTRQGFNVTDSDMLLNITIGRDHVEFELDYEIRLLRDDFDVTVNNFVHEMDIPLGLLYEKSIEIVNSELTDGYYDHIEYMKSNGNLITIEKHRPYPDIVYNLTKDNYVFKFAVQPSEGGCCYNLYDKTCFKGVAQEACKGIFDMNPYCVCPIADDLDVHFCNGYDCNDCGDKQHGDSWCEFDARAGKGYDFVGSRHYVHYCIDGQEYVEECKDFRQELCTEEVDINKAVCRPNRWEDCHACDTEGCCADTRYRDCDWKDWLNTDSKCVPFVPPGSRFWQGEGIETCGIASETKECDGFSCPNIWVDDTAVRCYMQGDCGNYMNIEGQVGYGGFFNSDFSDRVRDYVYQVGTNEGINLGIENRNRAMLLSPVEEAADRFIELANVVILYLEKMADLSLSDFLNPFNPPEISVMDIALCDVWQAPIEGNCQSCDELYPCTEYRCKSLGKFCQYTEEFGRGSCVQMELDDTIPPVIKAGGRLDNDNLVVAGTRYEGYNTTIKTYELLDFHLNTSEESVCRLKYLPELRYLSSPSYYAGDSSFSSQHNITMRLHKLPVPRKLMDFLNLSSMDEILTLLEQPQILVEEIKGKHGSIFGILERMTGVDIEAQLENAQDEISMFMNLVSDKLPLYRELLSHILSSYEQGTYYLFVSCQDRAGNQNDDIFIRVQIDDSPDTEPPVILGFYPENNSFSATDKVWIYLNEPAECKFDTTDMDYYDMENEFDCYVRSSKHRGSYRCQGTVLESPVFVRCMDNPETEYNYHMKLQKGTPGVQGAITEGYANVTGNQVVAKAEMLHDELVFNVAHEAVDINLYMDEFMFCKINDTPMSCMPTDDLTLGHYVCLAFTGLGDMEEFSVLLDLVPGVPTNASGITYNPGKLEIDLGQTSGNIVANVPDDIDVELQLNGFVTCDGITCNSDETTICTDFLSLGKHEFNCSKQIGDSRDLEVNCLAPETQRNVNSQGFKYAPKFINGVQIEDYGPTGVIEGEALLYAETSIGAMCGYYQDAQLGTIAMEAVTGVLHQMNVDAEIGVNTYYVTCVDEFGNRDTKKAEFYVEE